MKVNGKKNKNKEKNLTQNKCCDIVIMHKKTKKRKNKIKKKEGRLEWNLVNGKVLKKENGKDK